VPFFVKWPARLPAGARVDAPVSHIDVFATAAAAAGAALPSDRVMDGVDLLPFAVGERTGDAHEALFWRSGGLRVVLADGWKLQVDDRQEKRWLFHLDADPTETTNLIESVPARAERLQALLDAHDAELGPRAFPVLVEAAIPIDRSLADPYQPDEEFAYWPN